MFHGLSSLQSWHVYRPVWPSSCLEACIIYVCGRCFVYYNNSDLQYASLGSFSPYLFVSLEPPGVTQHYCCHHCFSPFLLRGEATNWLGRLGRCGGTHSGRYLFSFFAVPYRRSNDTSSNERLLSAATLQFI